MGLSDSIILPQQRHFVDLLIKDGHIQANNQQIRKIAHLGNFIVNKTVAWYQHLFPDAQHDLYDIKLKNWDINKEWGIQDYDIVVCHRTTMFVESLDFFTKELKKCIFKNKNVIFDFTLYMGALEGLGSSRFPSNINAKFDFRNVFRTERTLSCDTPLDRLPEWSLSGLPRKQEYFDAAMSDSFTEKTLMENDILPQVIESYYNSYKKDVLTYMFWLNGKK